MPIPRPGRLGTRLSRAEPIRSGPCSRTSRSEVRGPRTRSDELADVRARASPRRGREAPPQRLGRGDVRRRVRVAAGGGSLKRLALLRLGPSSFEGTGAVSPHPRGAVPTLRVGAASGPNTGRPHWNRWRGEGSLQHPDRNESTAIMGGQPMTTAPLRTPRRCHRRADGGDGSADAARLDTTQAEGEEMQHGTADAVHGWDLNRLAISATNHCLTGCAI